MVEERRDGLGVGREQKILECLQMKGFISPLMPKAPARSRWRGPSLEPLKLPPCRSAAAVAAR